MAVEGVNGLAVAATAGGALLVWSGFKGAKATSALRSLLSGQQPASSNAYPVTTPTAGPGLGGPGTVPGGAPGGAGGGVSGLAAIASSYVGKLTYHFGGPPPPGTVDCSSFASKCLNQAGIASPGGAPFNPDVHGPTTLSYLGWSGATTVGHSPSDAQSGDLCVWQTHMGIATGGGNMVSALDAQLGVKATTIAGGAPGLEVLFVRRLH